MVNTVSWGTRELMGYFQIYLSIDLDLKALKCLVSQSGILRP